MPGPIATDIRYFNSPSYPDHEINSVNAEFLIQYYVEGYINTKVDIREFLTQVITLLKTQTVSSGYVGVKFEDSIPNQLNRGFKIYSPIDCSFFDENGQSLRDHFIIAKDVRLVPWSFAADFSNEGAAIGKSISIWNKKTQDFKKVDEIIQEMDRPFVNPSAHGATGSNSKVYSTDEEASTSSEESTSDSNVSSSDDDSDSDDENYSLIHPNEYDEYNSKTNPNSYRSSIGDSNESDVVNKITKQQKRFASSQMIGAALVGTLLLATSLYVGGPKITAWIRGK